MSEISASDAVIKSLAVTAEVCGSTELSKPAVYAFLEELAEFREEDILNALRACRREVKGRLSLSDLITRASDSRKNRLKDDKRKAQHADYLEWEARRAEWEALPQEEKDRINAERREMFRQFKETALNMKTVPDA